MQKSSDLFVRCLEAAGVKRIYGVPGEENADIMLSLADSNIEFVLTRHEQGAAFMAGVEGRLTGRVGVCLGTLGPGATNLITGVADANMDNAPMLVLTGQAAQDRLHKESHQVMDTAAMFAPVTKWSHQIIAATSIPEVIRKAVHTAQSGRPGAVHIALPEDIAGDTCDGTPLPAQAINKQLPNPQDYANAWSKIKNAKRPIIIAGHGVIRAEASEALRKFCKTTGIGALMTFMAKGAVDMADRHCLYTIGMGQRDLPIPVVEDADLVIAVGYDLVEYPPEAWNAVGERALIHISSEDAETDANYITDATCVGDISTTLNALSALADGNMPDFNLAAQHKLRKDMQAEFKLATQDTHDRPITPQRMLQDLRDVMEPNDILLSGVGAHKMWVARNFHAHTAGTVLISNGFCSMGMPLPGAIGAAKVYSDRKIIGLAGDGDFMMNVQEMETARRLNSDITIIVWEDKEYGLIAWKQQQEFDTHTDLGFDSPGWMQLAKAFGWSGWSCDEPVMLKQTLQTAIETSGPSLVVIPIDYRENMKLTERLGRLTCKL